ncbi:MAG: hypothetical protein ABI645_07430 [Pseudomonadota bacterium]
MQIQINTDHNLTIHESEAGQLRSLVDDAARSLESEIRRLRATRRHHVEPVLEAPALQVK